MEDRYMNALYRIEEKSKHQLSMMSDKYDELEKVAQAMYYEDVITINDYLKLLEMYGIKYAEKESRKAYEYTIIRMQLIVEAKRKKYLRRLFSQVDFSNPIDLGIGVFLSERKDYLKKLKQEMLRPFLWQLSLFYIFFLSLLVFGLKFPFLVSFILALVLLVIIFLYFYFFILYEKINEVLDRKREFLDKSMDAFEMSRKSSSISNLFHKFKKG